MASPPTAGTPSPYFNAVFPGPLVAARPTADKTFFTPFPRPRLAAGFDDAGGFGAGGSGGFAGGFGAGGSGGFAGGFGAGGF